MVEAMQCSLLRLRLISRVRLVATRRSTSPSNIRAATSRSWATGSDTSLVTFSLTKLLEGEWFRCISRWLINTVTTFRTRSDNRYSYFARESHPTSSRTYLNSHMRDLWLRWNIPEQLQAGRRQPLLLGAHVAFKRCHVPVSRHIPFSAHMPPPRIFFVLCLDAAHSQCTKLHLVDHRHIKNRRDSRGGYLRSVS